MEQNGRGDGFCISGPDGTPLTMADLPPPNTRRWILSRKAKVVVAVEAGLISFGEACRRYNMSLEEFQSWEAQMHRMGLSQAKPRGSQQARLRLVAPSPNGLAHH